MLGERPEVQIDGLGRVRFRRTEAMEGRLRSVTVRCDSAGRWFATFTADGVPRPEARPAERDALGIDLGLRQTATCSDGRVFTAAKPLKVKLAKLRRYQRRQSRQLAAQMQAQGLDPKQRCPKGTRLDFSKRRQRTQQQIGRLHAQIADVRRNHLHQINAAAVQHAEILILEDLAIAPMGRSLHRGFRRGVADAGLGELGRQLNYKAAWHGRVVVKVDRWFPSSKTCSGCGHIHAGLRLQDSRWTCPACGSELDRDLNAAINIEREGLRLLATGSGETNTAPDGGRARSARTDAQGESASAARQFSAGRTTKHVAGRTWPSRCTVASPSRRAGRTARDGSGGLRRQSRSMTLGTPPVRLSIPGMPNRDRSAAVVDARACKARNIRHTSGIVMLTAPQVCSEPLSLPRLRNTGSAGKGTPSEAITPRWHLPDGTASPSVEETVGNPPENRGIP
jgi:IS605 OrfB family transposase